MTLKKTKFSNISWVLYVLTALVFSNLIFTRAAEYFYIDKAVGLIATVVLFGLCILFVLIGTSSARKRERENEEGRVLGKNSDKAITVITLVLSLLIIGAGVFLRIRYLEDSAYIKALADRSMIPFYPSELSGINGIAEMYYFSFLEFLFFVFGNFGVTVLILNIALTVLNAIIIYFALRSLLGRFAALASLAFFMLSPFSIKVSLENGPEIMAMIFASLTLLFIAEILPCDDVKIFPALFAGIFMGISIANDLSSVALLFCIVPMFIKQDKSDDKPYGAGKRFITLGVLIGTLVLGFLLALVIYSGMSEKTFSQTAVFVLKSATIFDNKISLFRDLDLISGAVMAVLLMIGIAAGFLRKKIDQGSYIFLVLFGALLLGCLGGSSFLDGCGAFVFVLLGAFTGQSIENLFMRNRFKVQEAPEEKEKPGRTLIAVKVTEAEAGPEEITAQKAYVPAESGTPLDNPLPVPEHKSRKTVDYDYYVSDNADYDV